MSEQLTIVRMTKTQRYMTKLLKQIVGAAAERGNGRQINEWVVSQFTGGRVHVEIEISDSNGNHVVGYAAIIGKCGAMDFRRAFSSTYRPTMMRAIQGVVR